MNSKSLKSQVTMLMIMGLVLFIVVSLVLYLSKLAVKKQSQQNIKITIGTAVEIQPIKEFVTKCLDKLSKDATLLLGQQGGYIYASQGGTLVDYADTDEGLSFVKYNNNNVVYDILPPRFASPPYSSYIPNYPWITFPYTTPISNAEIFEGYFGINNMPPLDFSQGPNSIQSQIETFVDNKITTCADFNIFKKQGFDIFAGSRKTSVTISQDDINIKLNFPITVTNPTTKESIELKDFSTTLDVRLKNSYSFAKELIEHDIKNIKFDLKNITNPDFNVEIIKDIRPYDDLIIITDKKSLINGNPYEYVFARRNRPPSLHFIRKTVLQFQQGYIINQSDLLQGSELKAEDPDEDNFTFTIYPSLPYTLEVPQKNFKIEVSDGALSDHQIIIVNRI